MADALPDYAVRNYLARLALNETQARQAAEIAGRLDSAGRVSVARLKEEVFPTVSQATANTNLTRLRKRINELSQELGLQFSMEITKAKRVGPAERHVWFEGLSAYSPTPATPELDAIPEGALLDTRGVESGVQPTAVLLTYNEHEARKLWQVFLGSEAAPPEEQRDDVTYYRLGQVGGFRVIHRRSEQGPYQAQASAARAIGHYNPDVLIAVGIAFGVAEGKQRIGDVLVSRHVLDYELARVEPDGGTTHRGLPTAAAAELVARAETVDHAHRHLADWPTVHFGTVLSGAKLVDNEEYRDRLRELHTTVIGGEMEGVGVLAACAHEPVAAIVVKSVCDFAAHKNSPTKADDQRKAALTSARMVREILARGPLGGAVPRLRRENEGLRREIDRLRNPGLLAPGCPDVERMSSQSDKVLASELFIADVRGSRLSMGYHSSPADEADGTPVVEAMLDWARDGSAPQLFALLGEYGAGKTVSCQAFARRLAELRSADPTLPMPIYFNLKSVAEARLAENLEVLVATCMREDWLPKHCPGYTWEAFRSWLRQGPCVVIFDGLDELLVKLDAGGGQLLLSRLLGTLSLLPDAEANARVRLVLSCRTQYFQTLEKQRGFFRGNDRQDLAEDSYSALTLLPLSQRQVRGYLERALPGEEVDKVVALIAEVHNLPELAARPYTLGLLAEFAPELERRRAAGRQIRGVTLYGWTVEQWLARDEAKHFIRPGHKAAFMAELAAWLWRERRNAAPIEEVERVFRAWVRSDEDLSDIYRVGLGASERERLEEDLRTATFIARRDGERGSAFSFAHTSLQEYFLARYLFDAVRADQRQRWRMRIPARETLDFLGQLLAEADDPALAGTLARWKGSYLAEASELHAAYAILANREGYPAASLAGIDLAGARLDDWDFVGTPERPLDLAGARMGGASLRRAAFSHAKLSRADLGDANLAQAIVHACSAAHTRWPAAAPGAAWQEAGLLAPQDKPVAFVPGHTSGVTAAAWHPGGHRIATTSWDGSCIIWDPHTGQPITRLTGHTDSVTAAAWHPGGHQLATGSRDGSCIIWDPHTGQPITRLTAHTDWVTAAAWHPDGHQLATTSDDGSCIIWDPHTGQPITRLTAHTDWVTAAAWHPDGHQLATGSRDGSCIIWDPHTGQPITRLTAHTDSVTAAAWHPDGHQLATTSRDGSCIIWDPHTGQQLTRLTAHTDWVTAAAWHPDGHQIATGSRDGSCIIWDPHTGQQLTRLTAHTDWVTAAAWHPDGHQLATGSDDGSCIIWDPHTGQQLTRLTAHTDWVTAAAWHPDGHQIATGSDDGSCIIWDPHTGQQLTRLTAHTRAVTAAAWHPDGHQIATGSYDGSCIIWDPHTGQQLTRLTRHTDSVTAAAWHPDGHQLATGSYDGSCIIWDPHTGQPITHLTRHTDSVTAAAWHPDGHQIATGSRNGSCIIWDPHTGQQLTRLTAHTGRVTAAAWHPDGHQLATGSYDGSCIIWDPHTGQPITHLTRHTDWVTAAAWHPDGHQLAVGEGSGLIGLWRADGRLLRSMVAVRSRIPGLASHASWTPTTLDSCAGEAWRVLREETPAGTRPLLLPGLAYEPPEG